MMSPDFSGQPGPTLRLKVDIDALAHNWRALDKMSGKASAGAAIKAECYGLGIDRCLPVLRDAGARHFFVAHWGEVAAAAMHVPPPEIAVLHGVINADEAAYARSTGAIPVINSLHQASIWQAAGGGACHLMVDTGINRLGVALEELSDPRIKALKIDTLMSHLACADEDTPMNARQLAAFNQARSCVTYRSASLANSAGIALGQSYTFDLTRPGIALYGGVPRTEFADTIRQVAGVEAAIIQTRTLKPGDTVGYNAEFKAERSMRVGTVTLGYADGFLRSRGPGNALFHEGRRLPILGKVSMDMIIVDLTASAGAKEGDWVSAPFHLPDAAQQSGLSQYEILSILGPRLRKN